MMLSVADRLDILDLLVRADSAATRRDVDAYVACFTDDAVLDGIKDEHRGRVLLRQSVGPIWESEGTTNVHLTLNPLVESADDAPDSAIARSMLLILKDDSPTSVHSVSSIVQHVVKQGAGWLISRRSVHSVSEEMVARPKGTDRGPDPR
jgi:ketosteroid isomerase-like protein